MRHSLEKTNEEIESNQEEKTNIHEVDLAQRSTEEPEHIQKIYNDFNY